MAEAYEQFDLPSAQFDELYGHIFLPGETKKRLVSQILLEFSLRKHAALAPLPIHGLVVLVGPPGTGKTSLAKGAASKAAALLKGKGSRLLVVDPHSLTSSALGKSQREVKRFFDETVNECAGHGPLIVLLDEVETMATSRARMSLEANPVDVHRATDAVLASLDSVADRHPNVVFVATSNFPEALDDAFTSRADLVLDIGMPVQEARGEIIRDTLDVLGREWPRVKKLGTNGHVEELAKVSDGMDGREIRKRILHALALDAGVALDPSKLKFAGLLQAFGSGREGCE